MSEKVLKTFEGERSEVSFKMLFELKKKKITKSVVSSACNEDLDHKIWTQFTQLRFYLSNKSKIKN